MGFQEAASPHQRLGPGTVFWVGGQASVGPLISETGWEWDAEPQDPSQPPRGCPHLPGILSGMAGRPRSGGPGGLGESVCQSGSKAQILLRLSWGTLAVDSWGAGAFGLRGEGLPEGRALKGHQNLWGEFTGFVRVD